MTAAKPTGKIRAHQVQFSCLCHPKKALLSTSVSFEEKFMGPSLAAFCTQTWTSL